MPETITGIAVKTIERAVVTEDGGNMVLTYTTHDGSESNLAIPAGQLQHLLLLAAEGINRSQQRRDQSSEWQAIKANSWSVQVTEDKRLLMQLSLPGGAQISFVLPMKGQQEVYTLQELLGNAAAQKHAGKDEEKPTLN